ncbi:NAD(P)H-quinone oxidoreductase [Actinobacteria bacterium YIM 96077]|uniref:NAD(P)H-quinone oxidoreductase n=1 Tax=Phytoactinopolyspora halophila TaxID=1981511 RepID=A0A329R497_9ACTN|nr:NAD(P)H-quinone oxidoreductase [Phytoactinopolyspora halophila]AYY11669.1 NAD(P)H-quinone oxidoreductase [Actinobacteria bacterium YIM 96077]RAW17898.1 NAD(P)H-quinone oxidoreductase [Phytoactinopolyspora halophila]
MHAVVITEPGEPGVLAWHEVPEPECGSDEVILDVAASAVNRADLLQRQGFYPPPPGTPEWPGLECSGTISAVGRDVTGWSVGDRACALLAGGGYAERVAVPAGQLLPVPAGVDLVTAAALPEVMCTVWSNVVMTAGLSAGDVLLVHGGSSGIGTTAIQVGVALGATVAVTAGTASKLERCAQLGASVLVNYREQDFVQTVREATGGHGADIVLDIIGAKYLDSNLDVLATGGRIVVIGLQGGRKAEIDLRALMGKRASLIGSTLRARPSREKAAIIDEVRHHLWPLIERGAVVPVIDSTVPMHDAATAHQRVQDSAHIGKVLLTL